MRHPRVRLDLVGCSLGRFWASTALTRHVLEQCSAHGQRCSSRESLGDNASYTLCIEIRIEIRIEIPIETPRKGFVSLPVLLSQHSQRKKERSICILFELQTEHWWDQSPVLYWWKLHPALSADHKYCIVNYGRSEASHPGRAAGCSPGSIDTILEGSRNNLQYSNEFVPYSSTVQSCTPGQEQRTPPTQRSWSVPIRASSIGPRSVCTSGPLLLGCPLQPLGWLPCRFKNDTEGVKTSVPRLCVPFFIHRKSSALAGASAALPFSSPTV